MRSRALATYLETAETYPGNPSGSHADARRAKDRLEELREHVAVALAADSKRVVFTSGGTEGANFGVLSARATEGGAVALVSSVEHHAVLEAARSWPESHLIPVTSDGVVDLERFDRLLEEHGSAVGLVAIMAVNNETGVVQPIQEVRQLLDRRGLRPIVFCDAVQATPWCDLREFTPFVDVLSVSAHKFGGPRGVGAVAVTKEKTVRPLVVGGGQEYELRSGTQNLAGIAAMWSALEECVARRSIEAAEQVRNAERFVAQLHKELPNAAFPGDQRSRRTGIVSVVFPGLDNEEILYLADEAGLSVSGGASCASGALEPSHVLMAMGYSREVARSSVRVSFGYRNVPDDVESAIKTLSALVGSLEPRGIA
jgi:cysteine desulfurase